MNSRLCYSCVRAEAESVHFSIRIDTGPPVVYILIVFHHRLPQNNYPLCHPPPSGTEDGCRYRCKDTQFTTFVAFKHSEQKCKILYSFETFGIALIVDGSIVIPKLRRGADFLEELENRAGGI